MLLLLFPKTVLVQSVLLFLVLRVQVLPFSESACRLSMIVVQFLLRSVRLCCDAASGRV